MSTNDYRICYCSKSKDKEGDTETYWLNKSACKKFVDMNDDNAETGNDEDINNHHHYVRNLLNFPGRMPRRIINEGNYYE